MADEETERRIEEHRSIIDARKRAQQDPRHGDRQDALRYMIEGLLDRTGPAPQWVIQPKHPVGFQLVRMRPSREPGPRLEFTVRLTTGQHVEPEEAMEMLETIRDMFQETFAASLDFVEVEPIRLPYESPPRYTPPRGFR